MNQLATDSTSNNRAFALLLRLTVLFAFLHTAGSLKAQVGERRCDVSVGGSAGVTLNTMSFSPSIKQGMKVNPMFGFTARYICEKYFSMIAGVQAEVNYTALGWKEQIEDGSGNTYQRDMNYLSVPLLMHMGWGRERKGFKFVFLAGPQLGFLLGTKEHKGGEPWDVSHRPNGVTYQYDHNPDRKVDYGIAAGAGLEYSSKVGHFILEARYYFGLGDTYDNSKKGYFGRSANSTIYAKLTYLFDIVKTKSDKVIK